MTAWLDRLLVVAALAASAGYALFALGPRGLRRRIAAGLTRVAPRTPHWLGLDRLVTRLARAAAAKVPGGCAGCDDCTTGESAPSGGRPAAADGNVTEIRIPLRKIPRRQ